MTPREELITLIKSPSAKDSRIGQFITDGPSESGCKIRPLGELSNFVCDRLGQENELIYSGTRTPEELLGTVETLVDATDGNMFSRLVLDENRMSRRVALLDLAWLERSLNIAYGETTRYKEARSHSLFYGKSLLLAQAEGRYPLLSWSDTAISYPSGDPRSFLAPGPDRDQEVLMYRIQGAIERTFRDILSAGIGDHPIHALTEIACDMRQVLQAMIHLNKVRRIGQFYRLDPFLGPNGEYQGHATGAFSAWTFLIGVMLSGNPSFKSRLCDEANFRAFDRDADPYIAQLRNGGLETLDDLVAACPMSRRDRCEASALVQSIQRDFTLFLHSHRGAVKRHAQASFEFPAPSVPRITNATAIREAIDGMGLKRARTGS